MNDEQQAQEQQPQQISDERIAAAQERIGALCCEAFKQGYERGYGRGFEVGVATATAEKDKKIILA